LDKAQHAGWSKPGARRGYCRSNEKQRWRKQRQKKQQIHGVRLSVDLVAQDSYSADRNKIVIFGSIVL
jgi:hypothetical protein